MLWTETLLPGLGLSGQVCVPFYEAHSALLLLGTNKNYDCFCSLLINIPSRKVEFTETVFTVDTTM